MGMNEEFLARSRTVFLHSAPASLQQVRDRVMAEAVGTDRRDMLSALDTVARLFKRDNKPRYLGHLPRVWRYMDHDLKHPALTKLRSWYDRHIPKEARAIRVEAA